ncbi:MAG: hypothetical protein ABW022_11165 [Actinoplanes sp.]
MTTTRIDHTGHNHLSTTAARTACRKAMKATPAPVTTRTVVLVGKGKFTHEGVFAADDLVAARCGAGMQRGRRRASTLTAIKVPVDTVVSCHRCR